MSIESWISSTTTRFVGERVRLVARAFFYTAIILALLFRYAEGNFTMPNFVYQGF
jgi:hypothetical protein